MRAPVFTAREALQFGVKNEQDGEAFYRKIAEHTAESAVRKLFLLRHGADFRLSLRYAALLEGTITADICSSMGVFTGEDMVRLLMAPRGIMNKPSSRKD